MSQSHRKHQQQREEFTGFEAFKKSSSSSNNSSGSAKSSSRWNESVKNQWNDPQQYIQEVSKSYERNHSGTTGSDVFDQYKTTKTISDRENDYTSRWRQHQLSPERIDPFASSKSSSKSKSSSSSNNNNQSNSNTAGSGSTADVTTNSNKRSYNEIYEENKIERERRQLLYQLKKAKSNPTTTTSTSTNGDDNSTTSSTSANGNVGINFETSGILLLQTNVVNQKGTLLKWQAPPECKLPSSSINNTNKWMLFENNASSKDQDKTMIIQLYKQKAWLLGRDQDVSDIKLLNPSCSGQHAVICFRKIDPTTNSLKSRMMQSSMSENIKPFIIDLQSTNGSFINGERIDDSRYYELKNGDLLTFGQSSREYIILLNNGE